MFLWGVDGSSVDHDNLNASLAACDAIVDAAAASATGQVYPTVSAALSAGAKSIVVLDGNHGAGFTVSQDGVSIRGLTKPLVSGGSVTAGARFTSGIIVSGQGCSIGNLGFNLSTGYGITVNDGIGQLIESCAVAGSDVTAGGGINFNAPAYGSIIRGNEITGAGNGILVQPTAAEAVAGVCVLYNWINTCGGTGIGVMDAASSDAVNGRSVLVMGNYLSYPSQRWGHGIFVEAAAGARVIGNLVDHAGSTSYNTGGCGIYVQAPPSTPYVRTTIQGNQLYFNRAHGVAMSAVTSRVAVGGNTASGNYGGNYANCSSCPGYASGAYGTNVGG